MVKSLGSDPDTEHERGYYPWESHPADEHETEDVIQSNGECMVVMALHKLAWERQGIRRTIREIEAGHKVKLNTDKLQDRLSTITACLALQVAPVLIKHREVLARGPHAWRELREVYAEVLRTAQERERYWRYDAWEEPETSDAVAS